MADADAARPKSAIIRRHEQLENWKGSEWDKASDHRPENKAKVKFQAGCVFLAACASGDTEDVKRLLDRGADINYANVDGLTALHQAVIDENQDMVTYLIEHGANIESQDNEGWTPLHAASSCGFVDIARFLIENGANLCAVNNEGEIPLDLAEEEEMEDFLDEEIEKLGIDPEDARNEEEQMMLKDANQWLNSKVVKEKKHPKTGATALHVAAAKGYIKVMEVLIQAGVDINAKDNDGWTPLCAASHWGQKDAVELLAENMADFDAKNKLGQTAFDLADEDDMLPYLTEQKKKQASGAFKMKKDDKPIVQRIDGRVPPPLKRSSMRRSGGDSHRNSIIGSSVTRISIPDRNSLVHQDMYKERRELELKIHGKEQDKKTMESSSSSETETESSSEEESESESEEEEEQPKKVITPPKTTPPAKKPPPNIAPLSKPVAPPQSQQKKELPSFSPKPLEPKKDKPDSNEGDTPTWRTGLRKTGSAVLNQDSKKPDDKLSRSASAPKISDQKPPAPWENQKKTGGSSTKPESKADDSTSKLSNLFPRSGSYTRRRTPDSTLINETQPDKERDKESVVEGGTTNPVTTRASSLPGSTASTLSKRRSFMTPAKNEESETVRKSRARYERSTRRSTQGVSAEDIESAVSTLRNKNGDDKNKPQDNKLADNKTKEDDSAKRRVGRIKIDSEVKEEPTQTFIARPRITATTNESGTTTTARLSARITTDDSKERERQKEKEKDNDTSKVSAVFRRRPREKRRSTGIVINEEEEGTESEEDKGKSTDRFSRSASASAVGSRDSSTSVLDKYGSRGDRNSSLYSTKDKDKATSSPCPNCKKLFEEKDAAITKLQKEVKEKDAEIADLKSKGGGTRGGTGSADNDKREKRALERRISELEEELKGMTQLKADNQRLKDENGALVRVISKLSK